MVCCMDSLNVLFLGLQSVQNSATRIVTQERLRDHDSMSRVLMELHWLPVDKRMNLVVAGYISSTVFVGDRKPLSGVIYGIIRRAKHRY